MKEYDTMVFKLENDGINLVRKIPKFASVKTGLYNERHKIIGAPKQRFSLLSEVKVPTKYQDFLLADYNCEEDNKRILLFCKKKKMPGNLLKILNTYLAMELSNHVPNPSDNYTPSMDITKKRAPLFP